MAIAKSSSGSSSCCGVPPAGAREMTGTSKSIGAGKMDGACVAAGAANKATWTYEAAWAAVAGG
jgi:hypothetical protein